MASHTNEDDKHITDIGTGSNKKYLQVRIPITALVVTVIVMSAFLSGYYISSYQKPGYQDGYNKGYLKSAQDMFSYNTTPDKWIVLDTKIGIAVINGTNIVFAWENSNNTTKALSFQSSTSLGAYKVVRGTLFLMSDPIQLPDNLANETNLHPMRHYIIQDESNNKFEVKPVTNG